MDLRTNDELIDILENRQNEMMYDAIVSAKNELEKRKIDTTPFKIRDKKESDIRRIDKSDVITFIINFVIFFGGFGIGGIYLIVSGVNELDIYSIFLGALFSSIGFLNIAFRYLPEKNWISYILGYIPGLIVMLFYLVVLLGLIIFLFYVPFFGKSNLDWDLGILILKDGFVRFLIVLIDIFLLYFVWKHLKKKFKKTMPNK